VLDETQDPLNARHDIVVEKIAAAEPGVAYPRCTGGRREAPPEDCGGIWAFNEYQAELDDTFDASEVTARLAGLAEVLPGAFRPAPQPGPRGPPDPAAGVA